MKLVQFENLVALLGLALAAPAWGGGVIGTTGPIDVDVMADYALQDYAEPPSERDPFTTSDKMYRSSGQMGPGGGQGFLPYLMGNAIPKMRVRGFVHGNGSGSMALLQIDGDDTVHLVSEGDEIGIQTPRGGMPNTVIKVLKVDEKRVEVQAGSLRQIIIVQ